MATTTIRTFLRMRARPGCEEEFAEAWRQSALDIRDVPGCLRQDLLADVGDPRTFVVVAEWADRSALDAFGRSELRERLTAALRDLRESADRSTYRVLATVVPDQA